MSSKNALQELCQKNGISLPVYHTWSTGKANELNWFARVTVCYAGQTIIKESDHPSKTKVDAEKTVATKMLDTIKNKFQHNIQSHIPPSIVVNPIPYSADLSYKKIFLIDLENKPIFKSVFSSDALYIGFITSQHHSMDKYDEQNWHKCQSDDFVSEVKKSSINRFIYEIDGGITDVADHLMTMFVYPLVYFLRNSSVFSAGIYPQIIIVSGDHAGFCTTSCLRKCLEWHSMKNIEIKNQSKI
jgi:hypothetical protein